MVLTLPMLSVHVFNTRRRAIISFQKVGSLIAETKAKRHEITTLKRIVFSTINLAVFMDDYIV